jgi:Glucodextranase, domain B/PASTA domain
MSRLLIAVFATVTVALGMVPAVAQATVSQSQITSWGSSQPGAPANDPYLIYFDNPPVATLTVSGTATAAPGDTVDIVCFYGSTPTAVPLASNVPVTGGSFTASALSFKALAGHACRLRAVPHGSSTDSDAFAGPQLAVSEAESVAIASGPNAGEPFDFYVNSVTLTGSAAWSAPGTPSPNEINANACGGPVLSPMDSFFNVSKNPAIDCAGALLSDDLGAWGGRSEVQIDGRNAYDAAAAQGLFGASQTLDGFPSLSTSAQFDPTTGLISTTSQESWSACNGPNAEVPTPATCPSFAPTGVQLQRVTSSSAGGRVVTQTDTWSSTDNAPHVVDLLYDDTVGLRSSIPRGYEFPGESGFSTHFPGDSVPGPTAAPSSILVHTNLSASDGDPAESFGAIRYSSAPSGFRFAAPPPPAPANPPSYEFEEHQVLQVPAGGSTSLSYIYSTDYALSSAQSLPLAAQTQLPPPAITIGMAAGAPTAGGLIVSSPSITLTGTATAKAGIKSLVVAGQAVQVASDGSWTATVGLNPGSNTISVVATDDFGDATTTVETVVYMPPPAAPAALGTPTPLVACHVPRIKGMKLRGAEKALHRAHCRVGTIKHVESRNVAPGRVMNSTPRAGRVRPAGTKIELFVSKGP